VAVAIVAAAAVVADKIANIKRGLFSNLIRPVPNI